MPVNIFISFIYNYLDETGCTPEHGRKVGETMFLGRTPAGA